MKLAIVGAGWAGLAAAIEAVGAGADVTVFEATREAGGRARALDNTHPDGHALRLDNGQHILIGAYRETLNLMRRLGVDPEQHLLGIPLSLPYPDGSGLQTPSWAARWPAPLNAIAAIATAKGWRWKDRWALVRASLGWQRSGFSCKPSLTVGQLCQALTPRVMSELIEPLCVSALNLPAAQASASVFLTVMRDALFGPKWGPWSSSSLLLPRQDLGATLPEAACKALGERVRFGVRVQSLARDQEQWVLAGDTWRGRFDRVIWATSVRPAVQVLSELAGADNSPSTVSSWVDQADALSFTAITTVYAHSPGAHLSVPMVALRSGPTEPAQFAFDRGLLRPHEAGLQGVVAFVISASQGDREQLQDQVLAQAAAQLDIHDWRPIQTVVEKRATFACTPALIRPACVIAPGLWAAGDYVEGPYPATLEGAVRSGLHAARLACVAPA